MELAIAFLGAGVGSGFTFAGIGASIGWMVGAAIGSALNPQKVDGPRLSEFRTQTSTYGQPINLVYGRGRVAGNILWVSEVREHQVTEGGKGKGPEVTTYTYSADVMVGVCEGPIGGIPRIWADGKLILDHTDTNGAFDQEIACKIYLGTEDQQPDPTYEAGVSGPAPAHRGLAYVMFPDLDLTQFGNRIPGFNFEVYSDGGLACPPNVQDAEYTGFYDNTGQWLQTEIVGKQSTNTISGAVYDREKKRVYVLMQNGNDNAIAEFDVSGMRPKFMRSSVFLTHPYIDSKALIWDDYRRELVAVFSYGTGGWGKSNAGHNKGSVAGIIDLQTLQLSQGFMQFAIDDFGGLPAYYDSYVPPDWMNQDNDGGNGAYYGTYGGLLYQVGEVAAHYYARISGTGFLSTRSWDWPKGVGFQGVAANIAVGLTYTYTIPPCLDNVPDGQRWVGDIKFNFWYNDRPGYTDGNANYTLTDYGGASDNRVTSMAFSKRHRKAWTMTSTTIRSFDVSVEGIDLLNEVDSYTPAQMPWSQDVQDKFYAFSCIAYAEDIRALCIVSSTPGASGPEWAVLVDPESYEVIGGPCRLGGGGSPAPENQEPMKLWHQKGTTFTAVSEYAVMNFRLGSVFSGRTIRLYEIVDDISDRVGLRIGVDTDTDELQDIVTGYVISKQITAREAIETLMPPYQFESVESDNKIKYVKRGQLVTAAIDADDLAIVESEEIPPFVEAKRALETDIPYRVNVTYHDLDRDYDPGMQYAERLITDAVNQVELDLPIVYVSEEALAVAEWVLFDAWQGRTQLIFSTSRKYAYLEPTDVVTVTSDSGFTHRARIVRKQERTDGGIIFDALPDDDGIMSREVSAPTPLALPEQTVTSRDATELMLLDIALVDDVSDDAGFYIAAGPAGVRGTWPGAALYRSNDGGATWSQVMVMGNEATYGYARNALGDFGGGNVFDDLNTVTISLRRGTMESLSELGVLAGGNFALLGDELIQFQTATQDSDGLWTLSGLLRGRRGTEWAMDDHYEGERFILLTRPEVMRYATPSSDIGIEKKYAALTIGARYDTIVELPFTNTGVGKMPHSVAELRGGTNGSGGWIIEWTRRARTNSAWMDNADVALDEDDEEYDIEIWDSSFTNLGRSVTVTDATTYTYTQAMLSADFASPVVSSIGVKVWQRSAVVGRGYVASIVI